ncbi:BZ3500_MvSof-1268-A1-R1_Chr3-2g06241 [Microbotryum saponariae]|uniref:BZ3500_MvSof-1268-A1-R1_Chr3-2g06241 protein n=1 Tax=Microbotryum saponariae TaxID=289078 RepID=A0A2X0M4W5_9BASI|nr:BZ3500_MvSof-1268-A1-R1_Chr3-2g06241 [Microbotryum saponariae]SDA04185.1 BZ3501_MvSof-1269-A2-R1_Chr3-2g05932 [Microbotryum saponariae]
MSTLHLHSTVPLRSGARMPVLGFGMYQSTAATASTTSALEVGYTHCDSARVYRNEAEVLGATAKWKKEHPQSRDIWLTTKATGHEHGTEKMTKAVDDSNWKADQEGLKWDLFLLHDPTAGPTKRLEAWKVLCEKRAKGEVKSIGVSNFSEKHLQQLVDAGQAPIVEWCEKHRVVVQAYCPLVRGDRFQDPVLLEVAKKTNKTPAQVLIRWSLQKGYVPLPKSDTPSRIKENAAVFDFELGPEDMVKLDSLDQGSKGACSWNPVSVA